VLDIDSHRAEFTLFEAARAYAAADGRLQADVQDVQMVAPLALRQRRSEFMVRYSQQQQAEDENIRQQAQAILQARRDGQCK